MGKSGREPWDENAGSDGTYGFGEGAALRAVNAQMDFSGLRFDVEYEGRRWPVRSGLAGRFNVYNILAAFGAGLAHGVAPETIVSAIAERNAVPGRFERVDAGQPFLVVVDYSHTGDALRNANSRTAIGRKMASALLREW